MEKEERGATFEELEDGEIDDTAFGSGSAFGHLERSEDSVVLDAD